MPLVEDNFSGPTASPFEGLGPSEIADRVRLRGTSQDHLAEIEQLEARGADQSPTSLQRDNVEERPRVYGESVIPKMRDQVTAKA